MELKTYLRTIFRKWWIVVPIFALTFAATTAFTFAETPLYQAKATFIVNLEVSFASDKDFTAALDVLSRRVEIATTYTEVAKSRLIINQAIEELGLSAAQKRDLSVESRLVAGTNVLEVIVRGPDPNLARDVANTVGEKTVAYVRSIYKTYGLEPLDRAVAPGSPVQPNVPINLALGGALGLVLGICLALLAEYLQTPAAPTAALNILDHDTGAYTGQYFKLRVHQELSRSRQSKHRLSVALIDVDALGVLKTAPSQHLREAVRGAKALVQPYLRDEDILARFDSTVFAILFPDMTGRAARVAVEKMQKKLAATALEVDQSGAGLVLQASAGITSYPGAELHQGASADDLLNHAADLLSRAEGSTHGKIRLPSRGDSQAAPAGAGQAPVVIAMPQHNELSASANARRASLLRRRR